MEASGHPAVPERVAAWVLASRRRTGCIVWEDWRNGLDTLAVQCIDSDLTASFSSVIWSSHMYN